jgi:glycosyltransferase involved in cell wall biosynthesis
MKLSICIPQYNRIDFLLKNLEIISHQQIDELEVVVSDDCSTDSTEMSIKELAVNYKYKLVYHRFSSNQGYDRNFRKCIELADGDYVVIIGNDDTINPDYDLRNLVKFLEENDFPSLGFTNFVEEAAGNKLVERANVTALLGTGYKVGLAYYSCFSFVGGLIYKKEVFSRYNSSKHDGSIYAQIYLGVLMISKGEEVFSIKEPVVIKDIVIGNAKRNSYSDVVPRHWRDYRTETGGLPSVIHVLIDAFRDAEVLSQDIIYSVFRRIYSITFPFWVLEYKSYNAFPGAVGLVSGLLPSRNPDFLLLNSLNRLRIWSIYLFVSLASLLTPVFLFNKAKKWLYRILKRTGK